MPVRRDEDIRRGPPTSGQVATWNPSIARLQAAQIGSTSVNDPPGKPARAPNSAPALAPQSPRYPPTRTDTSRPESQRPWPSLMPSIHRMRHPYLFVRTSTWSPRRCTLIAGNSKRPLTPPISIQPVHLRSWSPPGDSPECPSVIPTATVPRLGLQSSPQPGPGKHPSTPLPW